jgi:8-oxo-dGTP pyrophosphatase MutT (NUDIX family)
VREETGITEVAITPGFRELSHYFYKAKGEELRKRKEESVPASVSKDVAYFVAKTNEEQINISFEHKGYAWFPFEEAVKRITCKNGKDLIKKAHEFLLLTQGIF